MSQDTLDRRMMARCIELARACGPTADLPISALVCDGPQVLAEATNEVSQSRDVSRHAEIVALAQASRTRGRLDFSGCTLYSLVEPCAMCAFALRESRVARVVFALNSPMLGGWSKWTILGDEALGAGLGGFYGAVPEIRTGVLALEAEAAFRDWNPLVWSVMKRRGLFAVGTPHEAPPPLLHTLRECMTRPTAFLGWLRHATRVRK